MIIDVDSMDSVSSSDSEGPIFKKRKLNHIPSKLDALILIAEHMYQYEMQQSEKKISNMPNTFKPFPLVMGKSC
jgi:hypothetical protein